MLSYHEVINDLIQKNGFKSYIELGLRDINATFNNVKCERKVSVDINPCGATYTMSTDDYFAGPGDKDSFDIYFHDASHFAPQVEADLENIFKRWGENSIIVIDDVNPESSFLLDETFCGSAWQIWIQLRKRDDLEMRVFKGTRFGYIKKGTQKPFLKTIIPTFEFLEENRGEIMSFENCYL